LINKAEPLVSIIIRTKNEEKWISACLRSVFRQNYKNIEVILVDNESTDNTVIRAQEFPIKLVKIKDFFPGKAINDGIRASSGKYIVCLSGHCIPVNSEWLTILVRDLSNSQIAGVYGRQEPLSFSSDLDKRDLLTVFGKDKKIQIKDSFFHNASSAFRRDIWNKYPFDESLTNIEDRVWGELVISKGFNIVYEPESSVYHWHGIHQDLNPERAKNIVRILESLNNKTSSSKHQNPKELRILAVIPLKGESLKINNNYLIEKTIEMAKKSKFITDIVVATDNQKSAEFSIKLGVESPFIRPIELSEDYVDVFDVVQYTIDYLENKKRYFDIVVLLEELYPFRMDDLIDNMILKFVSEGYDTLFSGSKESRGIWSQSLNKVELLNSSENPSMPTALKESHFVIGMLGLCCVTLPSSLRNNNIFSGKVGIVSIDDPIATIAVRSEKDFALAAIVDKYVNLNEN
jgi:rhamnosyltransferase